MIHRQLKLNKIKEFSKKLPWLLAGHFFATFLALVFIALAIGSVFFYQYSILSQKAEPETTATPVKFSKDLYQKILERWQGRGERFEVAKTQEHPDPFRGKTLTGE